ncbi:MAG: hypothetical protein NTZ38_00795, partial [Candidatus Taylorbacteria bacterium]|nr:hypothetical protein [Candidatus Taylorbacteria bacterium]
MRKITRLTISQRGILILDIMLALTLATLFIAVLAESSSNARDLFYRARERNKLLDAFTSANSSTSTGVSYIQKERSYGNDRIETITTFSSNVSTTTNISNSFAPTISFSSVKMRSGVSSNGFEGTPVCSVDYSHNVVTGSYSYLNGINGAFDSRVGQTGGGSDSGALNSSTTNSKAPPAIIKAIPLPINPLLPLTDLIIRDGIAYISSDSSKASDPDLFIVDIHDVSNVSVLSSINTGPGISAISLAGKRIYAAADSTAAQFHIIRIDSLKSLMLETKYRLPLPEASTSPPTASAIFYNNGYIYLGTTKWDGDELSAIDISDPLNPIKVGGFETGSKVNDIFVNGDTAYVAASDQQQLRVLNVHDPFNIKLSNSFSPSGWQRQEGEALSFFE